MNTANYDSFVALADPSRREILKMLSRKKHSISSIAENFNISRPAISKHIKVLTVTGFITVEERGRERYCSLNQTGFKSISDWMNYFEKYWLDQLQSLDHFLKHTTPKKRKR